MHEIERAQDMPTFGPSFRSGAMLVRSYIGFDPSANFLTHAKKSLVTGVNRTRSTHIQF
jgi:hypothetical protein